MKKKMYTCLHALDTSFGGNSSVPISRTNNRGSEGTCMTGKKVCQKINLCLETSKSYKENVKAD